MAAAARADPMLSRAEHALTRFGAKPLLSLSPEHRNDLRRFALRTGGTASYFDGWPSMRRITREHGAFARQIRAADAAGSRLVEDLRAALSEGAAGASA